MSSLFQIVDIKSDHHGFKNDTKMIGWIGLAMNQSLVWALKTQKKKKNWPLNLLICGLISRFVELFIIDQICFIPSTPIFSP